MLASLLATLMYTKKSCDFTCCNFCICEQKHYCSPTLPCKWKLVNTICPVTPHSCIQRRGTPLKAPIFLTLFWLVSWLWILLEDLALPLEQSIIEWPYSRLEDRFFIDFSGGFYSWCAEINRKIPIPQHSPPHHYRRWVVPLWILETFASASYDVRAYTLSFYLLTFCSMVKIFSSVNKLLL